MQTFHRIDFGEKRSLTHNLIFGGLLIVRLVSESIERVIASVHAISQHVELVQHSLVCDVPPHGLIDNDLRPEQNSAEAILQFRR